MTDYPNTMGSGQQRTPPARSESPLFEPEGLVTPLQETNVPVTVMVSPMSPAATLSAKQQPEVGTVTSFFQQLREIEHRAKIEMAGWEAKYLVQSTEANTATPATSNKRKGSKTHKATRLS
jgi:hypothetical protein